MASEVAPLRWRKSKWSAAETDCVEVAESGTGPFLVRDSKDPDGPRLAFDRDTWLTFLADVKDGRFDPSDDQRPSSGEPTVQ